MVGHILGIGIQYPLSTHVRMTITWNIVSLVHSHGDTAPVHGSLGLMRISLPPSSMCRGLDAKKIIMA